jgi:hypothetical protein
MEKKHEYFFLIFIILIGILFYFLIVYFTPYAGRAIKAETIARVDPGITVLYYTFNGDTTDFLYYDDVALGIIENTTLERTDSGKIIFDGLIDLASDAIDWVVDLDSNVNISQNWIQINVSRLNSLRGSAVLYLYDLSFYNPRILVGGNVCPASICQILSYYDGTLEFSVTQFTNEGYSAEEIPPPPPVVVVPVSGGGGGGGGGAPTKPRNVTKKVLLELDAPISQTIFAGEEKTILIKLKNKGDLELLNTVLFSETNAPYIGLSLSKDYFDKLDIGEEDSLILKVKSLVKETEHIGINNYIITVTAEVGNYEYSAFIRFFINLRERDYEARLEAEKQIQFADEFFGQASDCANISYKIQEAWAYYELSQYDEALSLIESAMQDCREIRGIEKGEEIEIPAPEKKVNVFLIAIELIILMLLLLTMLTYYTWKKGKGAKRPDDLPGYFKAAAEERAKSNLHSRFEDLDKETWELIRDGDYVNARKGYARLYTLYKTMRLSGIDDSVKIECYNKLSALHSHLSNMK